MPIASGHERKREDADRMRERDGEQPERAEAEAHQKCRLVAQTADDGPDESALDDRAEQTEGGEHVAGLHRAEPEPLRGEQRQRRLEDRERQPVDVVDGQDSPKQRPLQQRRHVAQRIAGARPGAMHGFGQPQPGHHRGDERRAAAAQIGAV